MVFDIRNSSIFQRSQRKTDEKAAARLDGVFRWNECMRGGYGEKLDKSYGHRSGPRCFVPKSVVPLIITGRPPDGAAHTASFIHADQFTAAILFWAPRLVVGGGHTTQDFT